MEYKFLPQIINYDGTQLRSLYAYMNHGILGDSIISFQGACDISFEHMVDGEDVLAGSAIRGDSMLHFIIEEFGSSLAHAVTRQRYFAALAFEEILKHLKTKFESSPHLIKEFYREGDDLYFGEKKLSISIATVSAVSSLIHFALNITNENTPVKTFSLNDINLDFKVFSQALGSRYVNEMATMKQACCKVRSVL
jgi:hypothetical protein